MLAQSRPSPSGDSRSGLSIRRFAELTAAVESCYPKAELLKIFQTFEFV
jgi:hypothetical protein